MIVLDFPRKLDLKDNEIIISPFHTGHLGLLPGTKVAVRTISPIGETRSHCELIITPYESTNNLAIIRCTMKDEIGVVKKLVNALSKLKINIITEESTSTNYQINHTINMLVDLSDFTSEEEKKQDKRYQQVKQKYAAYDYVFPINDARFLKIFETIMAFCGDCISWKHQNGYSRLQLYIAPVENRAVNEQYEEATICAAGNNMTKITIPPRAFKEVRNKLSPKSDEKIKYVIFSDTKERKLRVYFPKLDSLKNLIHLGIYHNDIYGAMSAIFDLLAKAKFNIVTGLLRKRNIDESVWEGLIEYKGGKETGEEITFPEYSDELYQWVLTKLLSHSVDYNVASFNINVGAPLYLPKEFESKTNIKYPFPKDSTSKPDIENTFELTKVLTETYAQIELTEKDRPIDEGQKLKYLFSIIKSINQSHAKKTIFLSYPKEAKDHITYIKEKFNKDYDFSDFMRPNGEDIVPTTVNDIKASDYFLAIWHQDENTIVHQDKKEKGDEGKYGVSPWLPFELGIAIAEGKEFLLIRSKKVHLDVWHKIIKDRSIISYDDVHFTTETLHEIKAYFDKHFK